MEQGVMTTVSLGEAWTGPVSVWGLFLQADIIVKSVIVVLLLASVWSWTIILEKAWRMRRLRALADRFEESFWSGTPLEDIFHGLERRASDPMSAIFVSAMREWQRAGEAMESQADRLKDELKERIERAMDVTLGREMQSLEKQMTFLASVGSAAPFIGLFGTVWGIMNAFSSIAVAQNTSLATVAPGIAEALFATALGLIAAIPAVVGFNKLSTDLGRYSARLEAFATEFTSILSRRIEGQPRHA
ncbi:MAG: protein TolQ [Pseudomonadota bacterium]